MKNNSALVLAALVLFAFALSTIAVGAPATEPAKPPTVLSSDNIPLSYTVQGKGEPALVFVHCWCCDKSYWKNQVPVFEKKYKVVTLDLAGHGESGLGRKDYTIQSFGDDVASVVNALGLKHVILIGHSIGGDVDLEAARLLPGKVLGIVGVDTYQDFAMKPTEEQRKQYVTAFKTNFTAVTTQFVKSLFPANADSVLVAWVAADMASGPPDVGVSAIDNSMAYDPIPTLKELKVPIRCINSDRWPTNVEGNKKLAYSYDVKYIPGRGHFLQLEDPAKFNQLLEETIQELVKAK